MTDREAITAMMDRAGVKYCLAPTPHIAIDEVVVNVDDQEKPKRKGYCGFTAVFYFNDDGSLKTVGAWE